jgi:hypothetical protein
LISPINTGSKPNNMQPAIDLYSVITLLGAAQGMFLALALINAKSGLLHTAIRNRVIEPLGLSHTLHGYEAKGMPCLVHGYVIDEEEHIDLYPWYSHFGLADGGIQPKKISWTG